MSSTPNNLWNHFLSAGSLILLLAAWTPCASAGDYSEKTTVTFSAPVEIPGQALPAGTYVFKVIDSSTENNVVQVFNAHETHLYATFLAVPDPQMRPADKTVVLFEERPSDTPEAVRAIFCHGDQYARQFVYPHRVALDIARRSHQKVLQIRDDNGANLKNADITGVDASGQSIGRKDVLKPDK